MVHAKRTWCVVPVECAETLARKLTEQTWTLCAGFELSGWFFLNDSFSEDGAQEYGVLHRGEGKLVQVESVTFDWMTYERALAFIRRALAGDLEVMYGEVELSLETPQAHGRCPFCM